MPDRELLEIQTGVAKRRGPDEVFPPKLRDKICAWVARRRAEHAFWTEISREIGVPTETLKRWTKAPVERVLALVPVEVVDAPRLGTVTLVAPNGVRVEGATIAEAIAILRGLA